MKKRGLRIAAGVLLVALLAALASAGGDAPLHLSEPVEPQPLPVSNIDLTGAVRSRPEMRSALLCLYEQPGGLVGTDGGPVILFLMSYGGADGIELINIPVETRLTMRDGAGGYRDGTPREAYADAGGGAAGLEAMSAAVRMLLYDVAIGGVLAVDAAGFADAVDAMGGLHVARDDFSVSAGGIEEEGAPVGRPMLLTGAKTLRYMTSNNAGTDIGALGRQNHVALVFAGRLGETEEPLAWLRGACGEALISTMDGETEAGVAAALSRGGIAASTLAGEARIVGGQSWLPDKSAIKEYVLQRYYIPPGESVAGGVEVIPAG